MSSEKSKLGIELAQHAVGALEMAGMGIALVHDERELAAACRTGAA